MSEGKFKDLVLLETILGVLCGQDQSGKYLIHGGDFKIAIDHLGIPWGSPVIDEVMMHCKRNGDGTINFAPFSNFVIKERELLNKYSSRPPGTPLGPKLPPQNSSTPTQSNPFRADVVAKKKKEEEYQSKMLQQYRLEVQETYRRYCHRELSADELMNELTEYNIYPTTALTRLLEKSTHGEVSFPEFIKALCTPESQIQDYNRPAGQTIHDSTRKHMVDDDYNLFGTRVRKLKNTEKIDSRNVAFVQETKDWTSLLGIPPTATTANNVQLASANPDGAYGVGGEKINMKSSQRLKNTIFHDREAKSFPMFSTSKGSMISGLYGSQSNPTKVNLTAEQKLVREQILTALKRLKSGEINQNDFMERVNNLGYDVPDELLQQFNHLNYCGDINLKKCVNIIDETIFRDTALFDGPQEEDINRIKSILLNKLAQKGSSLVLALQRAFRDMDKDDSNSLSFSEFQESCRSIGLTGNEISTDDLRLLFTNFDRNGDGELQYDEFMDNLRGNLNSSRRLIVQKAFQKIDNRDRRVVSLADAVRLMNPLELPDVRYNRISPETALNDFIDFFTSHTSETNPTVTVDQLIEYYANISPFVSSDEDFIGSVKATWSLGQKNPAPPVIVPHTTYGVSEEKDGRQIIYKNHVANTQINNGDIVTWQQEPSQFEALGHPKGRYKKKVPEMKNMHQSTVTLKSFQISSKNQDDLEDILRKEFHGISGTNVGTVYSTIGDRKLHKNTSTLQIQWSSPSTKKSTAMSTVSEPIIQNDSTIETEESEDEVLPGSYGFKPQRQAGAKYDTATKERRHVNEVYGIQTRRMSEFNHHWSRECPFGKETTPASPTHGLKQGEKAKTLSEIAIKKKDKNIDEPISPWKAILKTSMEQSNKPNPVSLAALVKKG